MAYNCRRKLCSAARRSASRRFTPVRSNDRGPLQTPVQLSLPDLSQALDVLLRDAEAQMGAEAVEALRHNFAAIRQELAQSCRREQDVLDECGVLEDRQDQARLAAAAAPPEPDDADSLIAACRRACVTPCHSCNSSLTAVSGFSITLNQQICWIGV